MNTAGPLPSTWNLIKIPAAFTLVLTLARLGLELAGAPDWLASREPGGNAALLGISWLPLVVGPYLALKIRPHVADTKQLLKCLTRALIGYGFAARIPVVLVSLLALVGEWGTHYEKFPQENLTLLQKVGLTLGAQLIFWAVIWTTAVGSLAAGVALGIKRRSAVATS